MSQIKQDIELKVFITTGDSSCGECGEQLGRRAWITLVEGKGALCLACADLDHLAFLPSGDAALTRRARKHSTLSAVVLKWSRARKVLGLFGRYCDEASLKAEKAACLSLRRVQRSKCRKSRVISLCVPAMPAIARAAQKKHCC